MPMTLTSRVRIAGVVNTMNDAGTPTVQIDESTSRSLTDGVGVNQANAIYVDDFVIAASGTLDLDLAGTLTDVLGAALVFTAVKEILLVAADANTNNIVMGAGANPFLGPLGGTTPTISVRPGGHLKLADYSAAGWTVTPGTADILRLANSGAGSTVSGSIVIVGKR